MSKYRHDTSNMLMEKLSEDMKNDIAIAKINGKKALCQDCFDINKSICNENDTIKIVSYNELLKQKKELFGDNSSLEKKIFQRI